MAMSVVYNNFGGRIVSESRGGTERDYIRDTLGSTAALLAELGSKTDEWTYWPYGEIRIRTGSSLTPFTFIGTLGYFADVTTRLYVRSRFYLTALARWLTVDPLWPTEASYLYAHNSPVRFTDPSGLKSIADCVDDYWECNRDALQQMSKLANGVIMAFLLCILAAKFFPPLAKLCGIVFAAALAALAATLAILLAYCYGVYLRCLGEVVSDNCRRLLPFGSILSNIPALGKSG